MEKGKKKLLFVISRYGDNVHGGAELHCRQICERLVDHYDVEVATTKALDYLTWKNYYKEDTELLKGVLIRRFEVTHGKPKNLGIIDINLRADGNNPDYSSKWIEGIGPYSEDLHTFISENQQNYEKIVFFQYLYTPTYFGMQHVPAEKIIFVPLAHEEPQIYMPLYRYVFRKPGWTIYNTLIEKKLVVREHLVRDKNSVIAGLGIDYPENATDQMFKEKYGIENYLLYIGRFDGGKGLDILIKDFVNYKNNNKDKDLCLVLIGREGNVAIPNRKDIIVTGFIDDTMKFSALVGAIALVNPSFFESLSIVVLESFFMKRPILVNGRCDVLKDHCQRSNGGLWYENCLEFEACVNFLLEHPDTSRQMGINGEKYARENYAWDKVMEKWISVIEA